MQTVFIIGNGFDLNLGLKTSYRDFYRYYVKVPSKHILIQKLKDELEKDYDSWADLEIAFGNFTNDVDTLEDFDIIFDDLGDELSNYLALEQNKFDVSKIDKNIFFKNLHSPEFFLTQADRNELSTFKRQWKNHQWIYNIITLNYTYTLENIIDSSIPKQGIKIGSNNNISSILASIHHIHGFIDRRMILGVNDESQVKNKELIKNIDVKNAIIKENANRAAKHIIENTCTKLILEANLICIFGSSLGETDKNWWKLIGERLKRGCKIIIFTKGEEINQRIPHKLSRIEAAEKQRFLSKTDLSESEREQHFNDIYVGVNTDVFKIYT